MNDARLWGVVPSGFRKLSDTRHYLLVREDLVGEIGFSVFTEAAGMATSSHTGRLPLKVMRLRDAQTALIRHYRHGGLLGRIRGSWYASRPARPFRELTIIEELRRRGFPTVEVYAAGVQRGFGPFYRGCLITRELEGGKDLWSALTDPSMHRTRLDAVLKAAAETVRAMHSHGVYHADLNLKNILVRIDKNGAAESYVIDFDRAKLFLGNLPTPLASNNLNRLLRSARKLDPERRYLPASAWNRFLDFYNDAAA